MAFRFKRKKPAGKAVTYLGHARIEAALKYLHACRAPEAIHRVRKEIKKARAVLQLARAGIRKKDYCALTQRLRAVADRLSSVRDAQVRSLTLKNLIRRSKGQLQPPALDRLRSALRADLRRARARFVEKKTARLVARELRHISKDFDRLQVEGKEWRLLGPGVKAAYQRGRQAHQLALKAQTPEIFHEWRKRIKDLWYQLHLLRPIRPDELGALANELEILGEHLGDDHDLFLLQRAAQTHCRSNDRLQELQALSRCIKKRQRGLRAAALKIGMRCYPDKASIFSDRLGCYWRHWRQGKQDAAAPGC